MAYRTYQNLKRAIEAQKAGIDRYGMYIANDTAMGFDPVYLSKLMAQDSATSPNTATPAELTTYFDPMVVEVAFSPTKAELLGDVKMVGNWVNSTYKYSVLEHTGQVRPYSDYSESPTIELNENYENRDYYTMEQVITYGDREVAIKASTFIDWVSEKRRALANSFTIEINRIFFGGVEGKNTYGILTDPNRIPASVSPNGASGTSPWSTKTGIEIVKDIQTLISNLVNQSGEIVDGTEPLQMVLPTEVIVALKTTLPEIQATFQTVYEYVQNQFPNIEIIGVPQYKTSAGNLVDLMLKDYTGFKAIDLVIGERYRPHGIIKELSYQKEKVSATVAGAMIKRPWMISSMIGV